MRRTWPVLGCLAVVAASFAVAQVATGTGTLLAVQWLAVFLGAVMLPGLALVRSFRPQPAPLVDDLAWSMPVGLALTMVVWALGQVLGTAVHSIWPAAALVAALGLAPATRRRLVRPPAAGIGHVAGAAVVGALLVMIAWTATAALAGVPVMPGPEGFAYTPDAMFQVAMTGELSRAASPTYPMVAGEQSSYHWFYYAIAAQLGLGMDTAVVVLRLLPVTLLLGLALLAGSVARQISGRGCATAIGAILVGLVGNTLPTGWVVRTNIAGRFDADGVALDPIRLYWQHSPTQNLGWLSGLACMGATIAVLRRGFRHGAAALGLLGATGLMAAGSKSSVVPVLICGLLAVAAVSLLRRDRATLVRALVAVGVLGAGLLFAMLVVYPGGSYGLRVMPLYRSVLVVSQLMPALTYPSADGITRDTGVLPRIVGMAVVLLPLAPRLLGLWWLGWRYRDPAGWLGAGAVIAGLVGTYLTRHPGQSEVFFVVSAYPIGLAASAAGFALALDSLRRRVGLRRTALVLGGAAAAGIAATAVVASWAGVTPPHLLWRATTDPGHWPGAWLTATEQLLAWSSPYLLLGGLVAALAVAAAFLTRGARRAAGLRTRGWVAALACTALLSGGLVSTWQAVTGGNGQTVAARTEFWRELSITRRWSMTTPDFVRAAHRIRDAAEPGDVVATNRVCVQQWWVVREKSRPCDPRDFTVAAFTGLRTDVSGWAYADRSLSHAWTVEGGYARLPFWDPQRLQAEQALIQRPTRQLAERAWTRHGVRWVLADRLAGPVSDELSAIGDVVYDRGGVVAVRLRAPSR